jgi:integrase
VSWTEPDGRRQRRVVSARTPTAARARLDDLRRDLRIGALTAETSRQTVAEYLTSWLERDRARVRPSTSRGREMHVRLYLVPALGRITLARLTPADVERALAAFLASGRPGGAEPRTGGRRVISPLTVRHVRATLRIALAGAVRVGLVSRNAAADALPPRVAYRPISYLTVPDVRLLLDATRDDEYGPEIAVAVSTGLRLGELLGLSWADIDLVAGTLTVRRSLAEAAGSGWQLAEPKTARSRRTIPLPSTAADALRRQRDRQDAARGAAGSAWQDRDGLVFTDAVGRYLHPDHVSSGFQRARQQAGIPRVRFHDLRHSAATLMLAEGVPLAVISELLGHSGIAITASHYAAVVPELRREGAAAMDRALAGSGNGPRP